MSYHGYSENRIVNPRNKDSAKNKGDRNQTGTYLNFFCGVFGIVFFFCHEINGCSYHTMIQIKLQDM